MDMKFTKSNLSAAIGSAALAAALCAPVGAVVVVGGDSGWEVSFDGSVNGFYVNQDADSLAATNTAGTSAIDTTTPGALAVSSGQDTSRVMSGLLPSFFSFNIKAPTVNGLTGSARISLAPVIHNANVKNQTTGTGGTGFSGSGFSGSDIDLREAYFNIDGNFGTISVGRALSLSQRQNYLKAMTTYGVGVGAIASNGGIAQGNNGYGYLYPNYDARISYKTPDINGFQVEVAMFDPTRFASFTETDTPRFESEASFARAVGAGSVNLWVGGMYQEAESTSSGTSDIEVWGVHGGIQMLYNGFELTAMGYDGEGLGMNGQLTTSVGGTLTSPGLGRGSGGSLTEERDNDGIIVQGSYTFNGRTKLGIMYGESNQGETSSDNTCRLTGLTTVGTACATTGYLDEQSAWTVGVYHDVTSWLKVVAEYTNSEDEYHNGVEQDADTFAVGGHFYW